MTPAALRHLRDESPIVGWIQEDEPDRAQADPGGGYLGTCADPEEMIERYRIMKAVDPARPVLMNLSPGVADASWPGRGTVCTPRQDDYARYVEAADILVFGVFPRSHTGPRRNDLTLVADGVDRLRELTRSRKPIWAQIDTVLALNGGSKPTPEDIRATTWMALVHGARGIIYFATEIPSGNELAVLDDPARRAAVKALSDEIKSLAAALDQPPLDPGAYPTSVEPGSRVDCTRRRFTGMGFLLCVNMRPEQATLTVSAKGFKNAEVIGEHRSIPVPGDGRIRDVFGPHAVHLYRLK
jgi:hypothetical protein